VSSTRKQRLSEAADRCPFRKLHPAWRARSLQARQSPPRSKELLHKGLSEIHIVASMHERKKKMSELAEVFLALPGGAATLEKIFEQWTWTQLGIHSKPCGVLDIDGYFAPLRMMVDRMVDEGFLHKS
jgi:uncharacterized protein (TIGR00730 family)